MDKDFLLVIKMKNGDEEAMEQFVRQYYAKILQYCNYHSNDRTQAEDLTQETFARFFAALAGYSHIGKAIHYLYVIARNVCIDFCNRPLEMTLQDISEPCENPLENVDGKIDMERALQKLPEELREVVILHYFQKLSLRETAGILGIGLPLAKYRLKRAKEALRDLLGKEEAI